MLREPSATRVNVMIIRPTPIALIDLRLLKIPAELNVSLLDGDSPL